MDFDISIKVNTEILMRLAGEAEKQISDVETCLREIGVLIERTGSYWVGEAGDKCRFQYKQQQDDVEMILNQIKQQPEKLLDIAGVYRDTENEAVNVSLPLPGDIIS